MNLTPFSQAPDFRAGGVAGDVFDQASGRGFDLRQLQVLVVVVERRQVQPQPVVGQRGLAAHLERQHGFRIVDRLAGAAVEAAGLVAGAGAGIQQMRRGQGVIQRDKWGQTRSLCLPSLEYRV